MSLYRFISNNILFKFDPELIHNLMQIILSSKFGPFLTRIFATNFNHKSRTSIMGINLDSYISLAAGFDKNCSMLNSLDKLGFGYIVGGTITLNPRPGNLKPRIKRYVSEKSMINALGFPNDGLAKIVENLKKYNLKTPLVLSISGDSNEEIIYLYETLKDYCSGFEINISSPNTEKLKFFHNINNLSELLAGINKVKNKPYMLKIPRFSNLGDTNQSDQFIQFINTAINHNADGVVLCNTLPSIDEELKIGKGGLSGKLLYSNTENTLKIVNELFDNKIDIVASGGVSNSNEVSKLLSLGAKSVQIWTSLIYEGPGLVKKLNKELACE
ncbi:MAG: dihydroorotate dehydrogenase (quinone) [Dehalococcoidia bacterium]